MCENIETACIKHQLCYHVYEMKTTGWKWENAETLDSIGQNFKTVSMCSVDKLQLSNRV